MGKTFVRIYQNKCQITAIYQSLAIWLFDESNQPLSALSCSQAASGQRTQGGILKKNRNDKENFFCNNVRQTQRPDWQTGPTTVRHFVF